MARWAWGAPASLNLVKVKASKGENIVIQTAEYDGLGRRIKKIVTKSAPYDKTEVYYYDGQRIVETRDGSGNVVNQFIHGTRYIDELVMMRTMGKGDLYVHQDANWNVIGLTDLGGRLVERYVYTPYGEVLVHQDTSYGDRDGDKDVDNTDKGTVGATCPGTVTGACRIMDFDFDGDYDDVDRNEYWPALKKFYMRHPGRLASQVGQPFGHQGLLYDPEISTYQNRARQYSPTLRRFLQRDPTGYADGPSQYLYALLNPLNYVDPSGLSGGSTGGGTVALGEALAGWIAKMKAAIAAGNIAAASEAARQAAAIVAILMGEQAAIDFLRKWDEAIREAQRNKKPPGEDPPDPPKPPKAVKDEKDDPNKNLPLPLPLDPSQPPGPDWQWRGKPPEGGNEGNWHNPKTGESLHPDLQNPKHLPHYDHHRPGQEKRRIDPRGKEIDKCTLWTNPLQSEVGPLARSDYQLEMETWATLLGSRIGRPSTSLRPVLVIS